MPRDPEIQAVFERTDDATHGVWAYYAFGAALYSTAPDQDVLQQLPEFHPMTYEWVRNYKREDLVSTLRSIFPHYHARTCLIALVGLFENAVSGFWHRLDAAGYPQAKGRSDLYKSRLDWAFDRVRTTKYGTDGMVERIDQNRRCLDHSRRLRNSFLHYNGLFNEKYESDAIPIAGKIDLLPDYLEWKADSTKPRPIILPHSFFEKSYAAHLEILHQLHDMIQRDNFGETGLGYSYQKEGKAISWHRALVGI